MSKPLLIIISGAPGTGKTTLARRIARDIRFPLVSKDDIKELLFESLGTGDREWSRKLGRATFQLLYSWVENQLAAGRSLIVESNFRPELSGAEFLELRARFDFEAFQIVCQTERRVLLDRFKRRALSGERHPGHLDDLIFQELEATPDEDGYGVLPIGGSALVLDTTDFASLDYESVVAALRAAIANSDSRPETRAL